MNIMFLKLKDGTNLISEIEELVVDQLGEPNCKLINPLKVDVLDSESVTYKLSFWNSEFTSDCVFLIHSEFILTMAKPSNKLIQLYFRTLSQESIDDVGEEKNS